LDYSIGWKNVKSKESLTWGKIINANNLIALLQEKGLLKDNIRILELGFGYNRVLKSLSGKCKFEYLGIDISEHWTNLARKEYTNKNVSFKVGDLTKEESYKSIGKFDLIISIATLQHIFPSIQGTLKILRKRLKKGGKIVFDLGINRRKRREERKGDVYTRCYFPGEVEEILREVGLEVWFSFKLRHGNLSQKAGLILQKREEEND